MKKVAIFLVLFLIPINAWAISAESYVVMDYDSKRVLMSKNMNEKKLIASTTKIMTAIIALENKDLNSVRKVGPEVLKAYGSAIYLSLDEEITLKDLLYGLMLRSGNDAAIEIAYHVSGNMDNFVQLMNQKAYELGMGNTIFQNETFKEIIHTKEYTAKTSGKTYVWHNKNKLLSTNEYEIGGKTGYTKKAKRTLVTAATKDAKRVIVVTLNDPNDFADHEELYNEIFNKYERVEILNKEATVIDESNPLKYYLQNDFYALLTKEEKENIRIDYQIDPNANTKEVGNAYVYLEDKLLHTEKIYQQEETKKESFWQKFLRWLLRW